MTKFPFVNTAINTDSRKIGELYWRLLLRSRRRSLFKRKLSYLECNRSSAFSSEGSFSRRERQRDAGCRIVDRISFNEMKTRKTTHAQLYDEFSKSLLFRRFRYFFNRSIAYFNTSLIILGISAGKVVSHMKFT